MNPDDIFDLDEMVRELEAREVECDTDDDVVLVWPNTTVTA